MCYAVRCAGYNELSHSCRAWLWQARLCEISTAVLPPAVIITYMNASDIAHIHKYPDMRYASSHEIAFTGLRPHNSKDV